MKPPYQHLKCDSKFDLTAIMDVMMTKVTEYQIVSFLKYDKIHENIRQSLNIIGVNKN